MTPDPQQRPDIRPGLLLVLVSAMICIGLGAVLPRIDLSSAPADAAVRLTDTASWGQMPFLCLAAVALAASRSGPTGRRRSIEAGVVILVMAIVLAGNGLLNESVVKPIFGVHRPNIVTLAESGTLGPEVPDAATFYASGDKAARRALLAERVTAGSTPQLSELVRAHWIHEAGYSFPSGHTTTAMAFTALWSAIGLAWLGGWRQRITTILIPVWAIGIGWSRLLLEVHTAGDVIAGGLAGIGWGLAAFVAVRFLTDRLAPL